MMDFNRCSFVLEIGLAAFVFIIPVKKKRNFWLHAVGLLIMCMMVSLLLSPEYMFKYIIEIGMIGGVIYLTCFVSKRKAIYCVACAYALQHFTYAIGMAANCIRILVKDVRTDMMQEPKFSINILIMRAVIYVGCYFLLIRKQRNKAAFDVSGSLVAWFSTGVLLVVLFLSSLTQYFSGQGNYGL